MGKIVSSFFNGKLFKGDKTVWMIYFFLCMISLVEVYSASSSLTYGSDAHWGPILKHAACLLGGFFTVFILHRVPYAVFMGLSPAFLFLSIITLAYAMMFGGTINDSNRWVDLGFFTFQPSEFGKFFLIACVAIVLAKAQAETKIVKKGKVKIVSGAIKGGPTFAFKVILGMTILVCGFIAPENLSTALMLGFVVVIMMFIGRIPMRIMIKFLLVIFSAGALFVIGLVSTPDGMLREVPVLGKRAVTWKYRLIDKAEDKENKNDKTYVFENAQVAHANIAIANSNVVGIGPGNSVERDFLSHAESDFIFSIVIEETGIFGAIFVVFLYLLILIRVGRIAQRCERFFPAFFVIGCGIMLVLQALVNMGVAVSLFPVTGQPLPFISKGGSSILASSCYIGAILSISYYTQKLKEKKEMAQNEEEEITEETNEELEITTEETIPAQA